jgi:DNA-binding GntR family transcriptional regulator
MTINDEFDPQDEAESRDSSPLARTRLERLEPRALSRRIVDALKRVIIGGQLRPGDRVLETELAEQLGVSRGPVREAFRQLEQEGLLVSYPHRGTFVAKMSADEMEEVYALRAHLEAFAARRVAARDRDEGADALQELVDAMHNALEVGDLAALADCDLRFHDTLLQLSGFQSLYRIWRSMDGLVRAQMYTHVGDPQMAELVRINPRSHQPIVDAIRGGDVKEIDRRVIEHIARIPKLIEQGPAVLDSD